MLPAIHSTCSKRDSRMITFYYSDVLLFSNILGHSLWCLQFDHQATFDFTRDELLAAIGGGESGLIGKQLKATAKVKDWFFNTTAGGEASTKVFKDDILVKFLGGEVWSFKPDIPFQIFVSIS